jgi:hypothetical protein
MATEYNAEANGRFYLELANMSSLVYDNVQECDLCCTSPLNNSVRLSQWFEFDFKLFMPWQNSSNTYGNETLQPQYPIQISSPTETVELIPVRLDVNSIYMMNTNAEREIPKERLLYLHSCRQVDPSTNDKANKSTSDDATWQIGLYHVI